MKWGRGNGRGKARARWRSDCSRRRLLDNVTNDPIQIRATSIYSHRHTSHHLQEKPHSSNNPILTTFLHYKAPTVSATVIHAAPTPHLSPAQQYTQQPHPAFQSISINQHIYPTLLLNLCTNATSLSPSLPTICIHSHQPFTTREVSTAPHAARSAQDRTKGIELIISHRRRQPSKRKTIVVVRHSKIVRSPEREEKRRSKNRSRGESL